MSDGRKSNGGKRKGAGRPPKADEITLIKKIDAHFDTDKMIKKLVEILDNDKARESDKIKAIQLLWSYRWGKPKETVNASHTFNDFSISDVLRFKK